MPSPATSLRALRELGLAQVAAYARYQVYKRSGLLWRQSRTAIEAAAAAAPQSPALGVCPLPDPAHLNALLGAESRAGAAATAGEICAGQVRIFGGAPVALDFTSPVPLAPWPEHEAQAWFYLPLDWRPTTLVRQPSPSLKGGGELPAAPNLMGEGVDVKFVWEPARFGWAVQLARAAHLSGDPDGRYRAAFWFHTERFLAANPPGYGPNWASAQEAALRLMSLCLAWEVFGPASTPEQARTLAEALATHAARIPASLDYARAQNNNHRLSEAAGLYTAALYLPDHPEAARWRELGWTEFQAGLRSQISPDGTYCQHSTNYHRLMLQLSLWMQALAQGAGDAFPPESLSRLATASGWLAALLDPESGGVPVLGPNDGAAILPLAAAPYGDFRPALQAACRAFRGEPLLPPGEWDEMSAWFALPHPSRKRGGDLSPAPSPKGRDYLPPAPSLKGGGDGSQPPSFKVGTSGRVLRARRSWAYLRAARFHSRPGHADQLHLDLWWRGLNLAQDAGTYLYNAPPPWDNRLMGAEVHNTLTVNGQDQMQRASRFLYLDPAQAEIMEELHTPDGRFQRITARHHGYRRLGLLHVRSASAAAGEAADEWLVEDQVVSPGGLKVASARLHWLLPDLPWEVDNAAEGWLLSLQTPHGPVQLYLQASAPAGLTIGRAGERLYGSGEIRPTWGWASPNYGQRLPALSVAVTAAGNPPVSFSSRWVLV